MNIPLFNSSSLTVALCCAVAFFSSVNTAHGQNKSLLGVQIEKNPLSAKTTSDSYKPMGTVSVTKVVADALQTLDAALPNGNQEIVSPTGFGKAYEFRKKEVDSSTAKATANAVRPKLGETEKLRGEARQRPKSSATKTTMRLDGETLYRYLESPDMTLRASGFIIRQQGDLERINKKTGGQN